MGRGGAGARALPPSPEQTCPSCSDASSAREPQHAPMPSRSCPTCPTRSTGHHKGVVLPQYYRVLCSFPNVSPLGHEAGGGSRDGAALAMACPCGPTASQGRTVLLGVHRGAPIAPFLLLPEVEDAPSPTWGEDTAFPHQELHSGVWWRRGGTLTWIIGRSSPGLGFWFFSVLGIAKRLSLWCVCPGDAGPAWVPLLLLSPGKSLLCCAAASAIWLQPLWDRDVPWDKNWLGGSSLVPLQPRHRAQAGEGSAEPAAPPAGQAMVGGDL